MPGRLSLGHTLAVALVVHLVALGLASRREPRSPAAPTDVLTLVPVELATEPTPPPPPVPEPTAVPTEPSPAQANAAPVPARAPVPTSAAAATPLLAPEATPTTPWTVQVTKQSEASATEQTAMARIGLSGENHFMGRRETPEEEARLAKEQANHAARESIRDALHDQDVALGLGSSGPVTSALESVVRESLAPSDSSATLIAVADATGRVTSVTVEDSTDMAAFRSVADELVKRLETQIIRVPSGAHGVAMRIRVGSKVVLPSGGGIGIDPASAGVHFDVSDLGAHARRVVHARVLNEQVL